MSWHTFLRYVHLTVTSVALAALVTSLSWADDSGREPSQVKVLVRTIQASLPRAVPFQGDRVSTEVTIEPSLADLREKLLLLPFSSFHLIASSTEELSLKHKESIHLPNGQTLACRPMYMDQERMGLWLSWRDIDGSDILNTRIHFDADESVVTGTDYRENEGRILAIKALRLP